MSHGKHESRARVRARSRRACSRPPLRAFDLPAPLHHLPCPAWAGAPGWLSRRPLTRTTTFARRTMHEENGDTGICRSSDIITT